MLRLLAVIACLAVSTNGSSYEFAADFQFGAASSAYQVEGGWNASGKGESIWDRLTHEHPNLVDDQSTGDVACDSYNKIADDIQILKNLGVNFYRFSLSWSRILPNGQTNLVNADGIRYYNELIDQLLANGIQPYVTMYHWDLPQPMQELGGWPSPLLAQYFEDYADVVYRSFGDRVKFWITFNEPIEVCKGYGEGSGAPGYFQNGVGDYLCGKTILLAHARAYHLYYEKYQAEQNGIVGITISTAWNEPNSVDPADVEAAERKMLFECGWFTHPIFSETGDYPPVMTERVAAISSAQNYSRSRLPAFTPEEIAYIKGTSDFLGLNHYTTWLVRDFEYDISEPPTFWKDSGTAFEQDPTWETSAAGWLKVVPWGFRNLLNWIKNTYNNPIVYVTENGFADTGELDDQRRVNYYLLYLNALLDAINVDGCNVNGYTAWSLMDNMEWRAGYTVRFGLYHVDFTDPNRPRTPKASSEFYKNVISSRTVPDP